MSGRAEIQDLKARLAGAGAMLSLFVAPAAHAQTATEDCNELQAGVKRARAVLQACQTGFAACPEESAALEFAERRLARCTEALTVGSSGIPTLTRRPAAATPPGEEILAPEPSLSLLPQSHLVARVALIAELGLGNNSNASAGIGLRADRWGERGEGYRLGLIYAVASAGPGVHDERWIADAAYLWGKNDGSSSISVGGGLEHYHRRTVSGGGFSGPGKPPEDGVAPHFSLGLGAAISDCVGPAVGVRLEAGPLFTGCFLEFGGDLFRHRTSPRTAANPNADRSAWGPPPIWGLEARVGAHRYDGDGWSRFRRGHDGSVPPSLEGTVRAEVYRNSRARADLVMDGGYYRGTIACFIDPASGLCVHLALSTTYLDFAGRVTFPLKPFFAYAQAGAGLDLSGYLAKSDASDLTGSDARFGPSVHARVGVGIEFGGYAILADAKLTSSNGRFANLPSNLGTGGETLSLGAAAQF